MNRLSKHRGRYAVAAALVFIAAVAWLSPLDGPAEKIVNDGLQRALLTFASARALNAGISVAQGTELSVSFGAGATLSIGEILDPLNDLIESFSGLMLIASVSFGIQKILLIMAKHEVVRVALVVAMVAWGFFYVLNRAPPRLLAGLVVLGLVARFAIPVSVVGTYAIFKTFLEEQYLENTAGLEKDSDLLKDELDWWDRGSEGKPMDDVRKPSTDPSAPVEEEVDGTAATEKGKSFLETWWEMADTVWKKILGKKTDATGSQVPDMSQSRSIEVTPEDGSTSSGESGWLEWLKTVFLPRFEPPEVLSKIQEKVGEIKSIAEQTAERVVYLTVVFLLETLVVPLFILWLVYVGAKNVLSTAPMRKLGH